MIVGIVQARTSSSRLPNKVLRPILDRPMLQRQLERILRSERLDRVVVATSVDPSDDPVEELCDRLENVRCFRGSLEDVLDRMYQAARSAQADIVVRLTGDCPLIDPGVIDQVIEAHLRGGADYTTNTLDCTYPDGLDTEVMSFDALEAAWREAELPSEREHVTPFIRTHPERFTPRNVAHDTDHSELRWTVDQPEDLEFVRAIFERLHPENPAFDWRDVLKLLRRHPELGEINDQYERNAGLEASLEQDREHRMERYSKSQGLLERALRSIPLGSQTFSKSITQFPQGVSPHFIERGEGSHVWDVDGNEYVDFINGLCAVTLGYRDPDVDRAVARQLENGVTFSLAHPLEVEVAETIIDMVPCAEKVRFGKNGSDATSGAIRIARAFTGRDHIAVCGYHGWHDWYIGTTTRDMGIPESTKELSHKFQYNDAASLEALFDEHPDEIAAVILEPMNVHPPEDGFLEALRDLTKKHGALLVFDETITGFRYSNGGAQEYFGVTPDLATFGKGLANGFPVSAITGRADVMKLMEEIFFSFTFGGETLSLAAASAVLDKLQREPVLSTIADRGARLIERVDELIEELEMGDLVKTAGHPTWTFLLFQETDDYSVYDIKTLYLQEIFKRGVLSLTTHNMSLAHTEEDIDRLLVVYAEVFPIIRDAVREGRLYEELDCEPLVPLFQVR